MIARDYVSGFVDQRRFFLLLGDGDVFVLDVEAQPVEEAHVNVRNPNEGEPGEKVAAPAYVEHLEVGYQKEERGDVMAEAILASEEIEELASENRLSICAFAFAELAGLPKDFFVRDRPGGTGDRKCDQDEISELMRQRYRLIDGLHMTCWMLKSWRCSALFVIPGGNLLVLQQ